MQVFIAVNIFSEVVIPINTGMVNVYLIEGKQGWVMVDTGMKNGIKKIEDIIQDRNISYTEIKYIVLTHGHGDHIENIKYFKELTGARVLCHSSILEHIEKGIEVDAIPQTLFGKLLNSLFKMKPFDGVIPDIIFENELDLKEIGLNGFALHTPGHSKGSITLLLNSGHVILGDQLRKEGKNYGLGMFYEDKGLAIESLKNISKYDFDKIYLSHGDIIAREEFDSYLIK